jgi:hypothetical protein
MQPSLSSSHKGLVCMEKVKVWTSIVCSDPMATSTSPMENLEKNCLERASPTLQYRFHMQYRKYQALKCEMEIEAANAQVAKFIQVEKEKGWLCERFLIFSDA